MESGFVAGEGVSTLRYQHMQMNVEVKCGAKALDEGDDAGLAAGAAGQYGAFDNTSRQPRVTTPSTRVSKSGRAANSNSEKEGARLLSRFELKSRPLCTGNPWFLPLVLIGYRLMDRYCVANIRFK